jgi:SOS response regulatory protein OraA/RecX
MTSKSPDTELPDDESSAPTRSGSAGDSKQAETLSQLRSAISEIDQRHAEGESGFFAGLSGPGAEVDDGPGGRSRTGSRTTSGKSGGGKATGGRTKAKGTKAKTRAKKTKPKTEPDNGWVEGDASDLPDFLSPDDDFDDAAGDFANAADAAHEGLKFDDEGFDEEDDAPDFDADYAQAKKTAMNMLAMRDHSRDELRKKLLKRDLMPEAIETLLDKLENSRLLNDEEFAHRFVRAQRENRKLSKSVLRRELNKKGIDPELASEAVAEVDGEEDLAREVAAKKAASIRRLDYAVRERRILGMLARRGFPSAISIKVTREVLAED